MSNEKILILAAVPDRLRIDQQIREIESAIKQAVKRDSFEIKIRTAVRTQDIRRAIAEEKPQIVHFCGHGMEDGSLVLEDDGGNHKLVLPTGLAALFKLHNYYVKCVLLNASYSSKPAEAISQHIKYVIGMNQPIEDSAAIVFAQGFYDGLGYDNINNLDVIQRAFDEGIVAIQLENLLQGAVPSLWKLGVAQSEIELTNRNDDESSNRNEQEAQKLQRQREKLEYENNLRLYEQEFAYSVQAEYPLSQTVLQQLKTYQRQLGLNNEDVERAEQSIREPAEVKYQEKLTRQAEQQRREQEQVILDNQRRQAELKKQEQRKSSPPISNSDDDLSSERNVDYTRLRDLLDAGNWKDADYETHLVMLKVVGRKCRKYGDSITEEEMLNFPCTDLRTIDSLWVKYSHERFGFSVQKKIYLEVGGIPDGEYHEKAFMKFGDRVGWRKGWWINKEWIYYSEVTFDTTAPSGHLPVSWTGGADAEELYCSLGIRGAWRVPYVILLSHRDL